MGRRIPILAGGAARVGNIPTQAINADSSFNWSSYWTKRSLFFLDGTIIDVGGTKYFKDRSSAARNFLITGYDFDLTWTKGFPYKSAATISAPAGDATLIAADINNFLYDSGGTPNQIPVVSLFQNIDYANTIYCRHVAQVLDGNGVETTEPHVIEVFMASAPLSAADLVKADTYFGGVTEADYWIDFVSGNDANDGTTKALAKLTIADMEADYDAVSVNLLTGNGAASITPVKAKEWLAKGLTYLHFVASTNTANQRTFRGIIFDAGGTSGWFYNATSAIFSNHLIEKCYFKNPISSAVGIGRYAAMTSVGIKIHNCILTGTVTRMFVCGVAELYDSLLTGVVTDNYVLNIKVFSTILRNKVNATIPTGKALFYNELGADIENNTIVNNGVGGIFSDALATLTATKFNRNKISQVNGDGSVSVYYVLIKGVASECNYNELTLTGTSTAAGSNNQVNLFYIDGSTAPQFCNNIIDVAASSYNAILKILSSGVTCGAAKINGNRVSVRSAVNAPVLAIDLEVATADHLFDGFEMNDNVVYAPAYFENGYGTMHCLFVWCNNGQMRRNYVNGALIGIIMKGDGGTVVADMTGNKVINCSRSLYVKGVSGVEIASNTADFLAGVCAVFIEKYETYNARGANIHNNTLIYRGDGTGYSGLIYLVDADSLTDFQSDYNTFYTTQTYVAKVGATTYTLAEWQALGYDLHSTQLADAPVFDDSEL